MIFIELYKWVFIRSDIDFVLVKHAGGYKVKWGFCDQLYNHSLYFKFFQQLRITILNIWLSWGWTW